MYMYKLQDKQCNSENFSKKKFMYLLAMFQFEVFLFQTLVPWVKQTNTCMLPTCVKFNKREIWIFEWKLVLRLPAGILFSNPTAWRC